MNIPTTRFVFDRKKTASKTKAALIQIEILFQRRRKFVSTGVKVYKDQWSERSHIVNRFDALELNRRIDELKLTFDKYINSLIEDGRTFYNLIKLLIRCEDRQLIQKGKMV